MSLAVLAALSLAAVIAGFVVPAGAAIAPALQAGSPDSSFENGALSASPSEPVRPGAVRLLAALRFTLTEALLSSLLAIALGIPAAFLVARRDFPFRRVLLSLSGVPLCVPPVIIALAFVLFYGRQGVLNSFLMSTFGFSSPPVTFLYSLAGVVVAHGFYNFPVVMRTVSQVWERLPREEEEAALLLGAGRVRAFRTITLPQLSGAILGSGVLVFLYCFFSFVIVLLFGGIGGTTLEVELYQAARTALDFRFAGKIAAVETIAALGIVLLYVSLQRGLSRNPGERTSLRSRQRLRGAFERVLSAAFLCFLFVGLGGPLISVVARSFTEPLAPGDSLVRFGTGAWRTLFSRRSFVPSAFATVGTALAVSAVCTLAALCFALLQDSRRARAPSRVAARFPGASSLIPYAPLAVSSVMLGFGWSLLVPRGNPAALALAQAALAWPFAWTQIRTALDRIPRGVDDAALLLSRDPLEAFFRVRLPLAMKGVLSGAGFVFAISAGDATLPLVLSIPRFENLSLMLYRLAGSYRFAEACACATVVAALCGLVFALQDTGVDAAARADKED